MTRSCRTGAAGRAPARTRARASGAARTPLERIATGLCGVSAGSGRGHAVRIQASDPWRSARSAGSAGPDGRQDQLGHFGPLELLTLVLLVPALDTRSSPLVSSPIHHNVAPAPGAPSEQPHLHFHHHLAPTAKHPSAPALCACDSIVTKKAAREKRLGPRILVSASKSK
jgi:hypothetical protein